MSQASIRKALSKNMVDIAQSLGGVDVCGDVVSATLTSAVQVGNNNVVRITVAAGAAMHVSFGDASIGAVSAATTPAVRLPNKSQEEVYYVIATDEYIRADVVATRVEVIKV